MPFSIRHRDDRMPDLPSLQGLAVAREPRAATMAALQGHACRTIADRFAAGHRAYVARLDGEPAAWGWVATRTAVIGELEIRFSVPPGERYLWNFVTRPGFRGRSIYPRLLHHIVCVEAAEAERFWIIHAPENRASGSGIRKAGFTTGGEISFEATNRPAVSEPGGDEPCATGLLGLPRASGRLAPCWRCARAGRPWVMFCAPGGCTCDYQVPHRECGA